MAFQRMYDFTPDGELYAVDTETVDGVQVFRTVVTDLDSDDIDNDRDQISRARIVWEVDQEME